MTLGPGVTEALDSPCPRKHAEYSSWSWGRCHPIWHLKIFCLSTVTIHRWQFCWPSIHLEPKIWHSDHENRSIQEGFLPFSFKLQHFPDLATDLFKDPILVEATMSRSPAGAPAMCWPSCSLNASGGGDAGHSDALFFCGHHAYATGLWVDSLDQQGPTGTNSFNKHSWRLAQDDYTWLYHVMIVDHHHEVHGSFPQL